MCLVGDCVPSPCCSTGCHNTYPRAVGRSWMVDLGSPSPADYTWEAEEGPFFQMKHKAEIQDEETSRPCMEPLLPARPPSTLGIRCQSL